jgi:hypothetical protein
MQSTAGAGLTVQFLMLVNPPAGGAVTGTANVPSGADVRFEFSGQQEQPVPNGSFLLPVPERLGALVSERGGFSAGRDLLGEDGAGGRGRTAPCETSRSSDFLPRSGGWRQRGRVPTTGNRCV